MSVGNLALAPAHARLSDVQRYGALFALAVAAFCLSRAAGEHLGPASDLVAIAGDATCGWSWLLVRALFPPQNATRASWPLVLVLLLVAAGAIMRLPGDSAAPLHRMVQNLGVMISSTLLLLAAIEPLKGLTRSPTARERRFRIAFSGGYVSVLAVAVVWVNGAPGGSLAAQWSDAIKAVCALLALAGMVFAIWYRGRCPAWEPARARRSPDAGAVSLLGDRVLRLMTDDAIYTRHNLKVSDLARRLGEPAYRVTQSITGPLGFANFNHLANHFRIEDAKRRLADPAFDHLPVLTIAFDCGFGSIGPFNRAFRAATGVTPTVYRRDAASGSA